MGKKIEYCPTCYQLLPKEQENPLEAVMCSEYHVICIKCRWPVAKIFVEDGICRMCRMTAKKIREENKKLKVV